MKKFLIGGLVLALLLGGITGCSDDSSSSGDSRVVAPEYRGEFRQGSSVSNYFIFTEKEVHMGAGDKFPAWTKADIINSDRTNLWYLLSDGKTEDILGRFTDENTFIYREGTYKRVN